MKLAVCALSAMMLVLSPATRAEPIAMKADTWAVRGEAEFAEYKGFSALKLKQTSAQAVPKDVILSNGTIEFDVESQGVMGVGVGFRRVDSENYEDFYFRPKPNCATSIDCLQYAPMVHGVLLWDFFPQFQHAAPLRDGEWNHVKLVIAGKRLSIIVNGTPVLTDAQLAGGTPSGGLVLHGPGAFANLTVHPETVEALSPIAAAVEKEDARFVRHWRVSTPSILAADQEPALADMPTARSSWRPLTAEKGGLVNLTRLYGKPVSAPNRAMAWLKTAITAREATSTTVNIGICREVWVFVNGTRVFADKNPYQPPQARKAPDGRCTPQNASFVLPLKAGANDIAVAVANNFYGWGIILQMADTKGLRFARP